MGRLIILLLSLGVALGVNQFSPGDSQCLFLGQFVRHPTNDCKYKVCTYGNEPWLVANEVIQLILTDMKCPNGVSVNVSAFSQQHADKKPITPCVIFDNKCLVNGKTTTRLRTRVKMHYDTDGHTFSKSSLKTSYYAYYPGPLITIPKHYHQPKQPYLHPQPYNLIPIPEPYKPPPNPQPYNPPPKSEPYYPPSKSEPYNPPPKSEPYNPPPKREPYKAPPKRKPYKPPPKPEPYRPPPQSFNPPPKPHKPTRRQPYKPPFKPQTNFYPDHMFPPIPNLHTFSFAEPQTFKPFKPNKPKPFSPPRFNPPIFSPPMPEMPYYPEPNPQTYSSSSQSFSSNSGFSSYHYDSANPHANNGKPNTFSTSYHYESHDTKGKPFKFNSGGSNSEKPFKPWAHNGFNDGYNNNGMFRDDMSFFGNTGGDPEKDIRDNINTIFNNMDGKQTTGFGNNFGPFGDDDLMSSLHGE